MERLQMTDTVTVRGICARIPPNCPYFYYSEDAWSKIGEWRQEIVDSSSLGVENLGPKSTTILAAVAHFYWLEEVRNRTKEPPPAHQTTTTEFDPYGRECHAQAAQWARIARGESQ